MHSDKRYLFQGHAVAAAARFLRYDDRPIQVDACLKDASAALPAEGGCLQAASARQEIRFEENLLFAFDSATAAVSGGFSDPQAAFEQTLQETREDNLAVHVECSTTLTNLSVVERLSIEFLESHLVADDPRGGGRVRFTAPRPPHIDGVVLDGKRVVVHIDSDDVFLTLPTKDDVLHEHEISDFFRKLCDLRHFFNHDNYIVTSIVKELTFPDGLPVGVEQIANNALKVRDFGKIFFGELLIGGTTRRLTLLRLQLGSNAGGSATAGESKPNGETT